MPCSPVKLNPLWVIDPFDATLDGVAIAGTMVGPGLAANAERLNPFDHEEHEACGRQEIRREGVRVFRV